MPKAEPSIPPPLKPNSNPEPVVAPTLEQTVDVPALLRLPSLGSYFLFAAFAVTVLTLAYTAGGEPMQAWQGIVSLVITLAAALFALTAGPYPVKIGPALAIAVAPAVAAALIAVNMNPGGLPGYTAWYVLSGTFILLTLAVRGRIALAWAGFVAMVAVNVVWAASTGRSPVLGLIMMQAATAILVFGSLFAVGLRSMMRRLQTFSELEQRRAAEAAAAAATAHERRDRVDALQKLVREPLTALASDAPLGPHDRARLRALEGELRDQIRGRNFVAEPAVSAVRAARLRGIDVLLLDDLQHSDLDAAARARIAGRVASVLDELENGTGTGTEIDGDRGSVTIRLSATELDQIMLSFVVDEHDVTRRIVESVTFP